MTPGPTNSLLDIAGLRVGQASDAAIKTGTTVVLADTPVTASYAVLGGAPGSRETDLLEPDKSAPGVDAFVLSGGSAFGLDAATGVMERLRAMGRGVEVGPVRVPIVPGAIIFDLLSGGARDWTASPYPELGRRAIDAVGAPIEIGSHGAGTGAMTGRMKGGIGTASLDLGGGAMVAALIVANPSGSPCTPGDRHFWAAPFEVAAEFGGIGPDSATGLVAPLDNLKYAAAEKLANTTIGLVATNVALGKAECKRLAVAAHDGIARAIVPAHTPGDGDLLFAASTGTGPALTPALAGELGAAAAHCVARAIARGVHAATPAPGDILPTWGQINEGAA